MALAHTTILSGKDLQGGGTRMGLTREGRLGLITNVRDPENIDPAAPSRGEIVPLWLRGDTHMDYLWPRLAMGGYNGFNLLALDFAADECHWISNAPGYQRPSHAGAFDSRPARGL